MRILPWVALGCAFSPVLSQIARAIPEAPFGWSLLLAPALLCAALARRGGGAPPRRGWGALALIAGLLVQLIGLAGGSPGAARLGLPIAVVGLSLWNGAPRAMAALLALWVLPIPGTLYALTTPGLESAYARWAAGAVGARGADGSASGPLLRSGAQRMELDPHHSGIHLVFLLTELSWYAAVRSGLAPAVALARSALLALLAAPIQLAAVGLAVLLLAAGASEIADLWLDHGLWWVTALAGVGWIEGRRARAKRPRTP